MIKTCEELNQARVQAQLEIQSYACRILVCSGTGCIATGSHKIHAQTAGAENGQLRRGQEALHH